jgi:hypothetical protein
MDAAALPVLFRLLAMGTRSLLQYVSEASPWSTPDDVEARAEVLRIAREERDEVARLTRILQKKHVRVPTLGSYPSHFTTTNFVSVEYLVPKLVSEHEKEILEIQRYLQVVDDEEFRGLAQGYLDMKRRHLHTLRGLSPDPAAATVV